MENFKNEIEGKIEVEIAGKKKCFGRIKFEVG
jgi:hypothetical protein